MGGDRDNVVCLGVAGGKGKPGEALEMLTIVFISRL